jgi:hypothetical protein
MMLGHFGVIKIKLKNSKIVLTKEKELVITMEMEIASHKSSSKSEDEEASQYEIVRKQKYALFSNCVRLFTSAL